MIINNFLGKKFTIFSFQSNIIAIIISGILKNKIIIRSNSSPNFYAKNIIKRKIMSLFFGMADKIVVNSDDFEREFKKYFNLKSIRIYNLMEDQPRLKKLYNQKVKFNFFDKNKKSLKIVSIGRLVSQKDHITILKALNLIKEKKNFKFCIIGKGIEYNNLQKYIISNNLRNKVKLIGYKKNIYPFLKKADIFILSSLYEGLPNTLLEAVSTGIPIISSNCKTGPREILNKKKYGKLFKIRNYVALSKLIKKSKKKNYSKFINDHRFDFKKNLEKYKKVILSL